MASSTLRVGAVSLALLATPAPASAADNPDPDLEACLSNPYRLGDCGAVEIVDARGRPIADAKVTWSNDKATTEMINAHPDANWFWWGNTNARGHVYATQLAAGRGLLEVQAPERLGGRCAGVTKRRWRGKATPSPVRVVLNMRPVPLADVRGRIVDNTGRGVEGAKVRLLGATWKPARGEDCAVSPEIEATSAADGAFVLASVPHGTATFVVKHSDHAEREVQVAVPGPVPDVALAAGTTWNGRILRPDGSVVERCEIGLTIAHPPATRAAACSPAGFTLDHLPPGPARLSVSTRKGFDARLGGRVLVEDVQIEASERWQRDFRWPAGDTIAGRVVTADGVPVPKEGVFVVPKHQNVRNGSGHGVWMYTDADGRFAFLHLSPAGEWILTLSAGAYREARVKVTTGSVDVVVTAVAK